MLNTAAAAATTVALFLVNTLGNHCRSNSMKAVAKKIEHNSSNLIEKNSLVVKIE